MSISVGPTASTAVTLHCLPIREYLSYGNIKSVVRGFITEYETPKIVTIHSISIALMCRLIQGYQETDTSIISSITLKVKGIGINQTSKNQTLVIDAADYIVPPQENNALFIMTNFIRTDQEHKRCEESPGIAKAKCVSNTHCICLKPNNSLPNTTGICQLEGWCPVENDSVQPSPIKDASHFTIFVKNFIEFPRFKVKRKNTVNTAKSCIHHSVTDKECPIFRVGDLLEEVEPEAEERDRMLTYGGVIRVKIDWDCNLDKPLSECKPVYTFGRLDTRFNEENFSYGFNFRFASHWKHQNHAFRTLTKAFGLRMIMSVSGRAGKLDFITLSLNIGSLIGILGLATFICDIVALYLHRQSTVYRQQKFQDVDLNLMRLERLNSMVPGTDDRIKQNHEQRRSTIDDSAKDVHKRKTKHKSRKRSLSQNHLSHEQHHNFSLENSPDMSSIRNIDSSHSSSGTNNASLASPVVTPVMSTKHPQQQNPIISRSSSFNKTLSPQLSPSATRRLKDTNSHRSKHNRSKSRDNVASYEHDRLDKLLDGNMDEGDNIVFVDDDVDNEDDKASINTIQFHLSDQPVTSKIDNTMISDLLPNPKLETFL
ncbi:unnamed protein product [Didymodactylos carnosus]|uniref:ATP receptor n=1 Tax=Didymodactylos carnosus TaxID=1234261 RepID=A0A814BT66_9BILA|nr:unnamed protein product [Didymodactylos carnosus]CAF3711261.1 unnamed protein product [Didymodactylos carnosus]